MSVMNDLRRTAEAIASLGPLRARLRRPAQVRPGQAGVQACIVVSTRIPRPANVGGGVVKWTGYVDFIDNEHVEKLNTLLRLLMEMAEDVGPLLAAVRNAYERTDAAREAQRSAEERLDRVLTGGPSRARGTFHVALGADGGAWLLDPEKRGNGFGFWFACLDDLWRAHPELRPVAWGADERGPFLTVKSFAMRES